MSTNMPCLFFSGQGTCWQQILVITALIIQQRAHLGGSGAGGSGGAEANAERKEASRTSLQGTAGGHQIKVFFAL